MAKNVVFARIPLYRRCRPEAPATAEFLDHALGTTHPFRSAHTGDIALCVLAISPELVDVIRCPVPDIEQ